MIAERFPIGILPHPIAPGQTCVDRFFQSTERSFLFAQNGQGTAGIVKDGVVVGRQGLCSIDALLRAFALAQPRQCPADQDIWARLVIVQIDVFGRAFQCIFLRITRLVRAANHSAVSCSAASVPSRFISMSFLSTLDIKLSTGSNETNGNAADASRIRSPRAQTLS